MHTIKLLCIIVDNITATPREFRLLRNLGGFFIKKLRYGNNNIEYLTPPVRFDQQLEQLSRRGLLIYD